MKRVLLDENLPRRLKSHFSNNLTVTTVPDLGWQSKQNGELLAAMESEGFDVLVTADRNLRFQQNLSKYGVRVVVLLIYDNQLKTLIPHVSAVESTILEDSAGEVVELDLRGREPTS